MAMALYIIILSAMIMTEITNSDRQSVEEFARLHEKLDAMNTTHFSQLGLLQTQTTVHIQGFKVHIDAELEKLRMALGMYFVNSTMG
jgi:hypothetical protein